MGSKEIALVDFGQVCINTNSVRLFEVFNSSSIDQIFTVEKFTNLPRLASGFTISPCTSPTIKPNEAFTFKIEFTPKYVNSNCSDLFIIKHLYGVKETLFTKCIVDGPNIVLSCKQMQFHFSADERSKSKQFDLVNIGNCCAYFQFLGDDNDSCIRIKPLEGRIVPSKSIHITVNCRVAAYKPIFRRVFCLVERHEPLTLDIFVFCSHSKNLSTMVFPLQSTTNENGYMCFMQDIMTKSIKSELPVISLDKYYIDFGSCYAKYEKEMQFSLTNNFNDKFNVTWIKSNLDKTFDIKPSTADVEARKTLPFKVTFKPSVRDKLYNVTFEANLYTSDCRIVPFPVNLHLKGNSFDALDCGWAAQYRLDPINLVFPPTSGPPQYSTLIVYKIGHLPLAFRFHPPPCTNFTVKPEQGLIQDKFQIVVVQFSPSSSCEALYTEKWVLSFNSNERINQCTVEFGGSVEIPHLVINYNKDVVFPKIHPGTSYELLVELFNPTRIVVEYKLEVLKGEEVLTVESGGLMWPLERKHVPWCVHPQGIGYLEALVRCTPSESHTVSRSTDVLVQAICEETKLEAIPYKLDFHQVLCGYHQERGFEVINNGDAVINVELVSMIDDHDTFDINVILSPNEVHLEPGSSSLISLFVTPKKRGRLEFMLGYKVLNCQFKPLVTVTVVSVFPKLKITDITLCNTGPLFTQYSFWKMLQIDKLNRVLQNLTEGENEDVHMQLPSYMVNSQAISIEILLENLFELGVSLTVAQHAVCDCKPQLTQVSFNRSIWKNKCPHKNQLKIDPLNTSIEPQAYTILNINVLYTTVGKVEFLYTICISPENYEDVQSRIKLYLNRTSIPEQESYLDSHGIKENNEFVFYLRPVFIGDICPFYQAFTTYNNTNQTISYRVDDTNLLHTPFKYLEVDDVISPVSNHCLFFTFLPYRCELFEAEVLLIFNSQARKIILRGKGVAHALVEDEIEDVFSTKGDKLVQLNPKSNYLSTSHVKFGPINPSSTQKHLIMFNNNTKDSVSLKWCVRRVPNVAELSVVPAKGLVPPGGQACFRVVCHSVSACHLTTTFVCTYASYTQYCKTSEALNTYCEDQITFGHYFIITEDGSNNVVPETPKDKWPKKNYLTVSVTLDIRHKTRGFDEFLPIVPISMQINPFCVNLFREMPDEWCLSIIDVFEKLLWQTLVEISKSDCDFKSKAPVYYSQLCSAKPGTITVPAYVYQTVMENIIYSSLRDLFCLDFRNDSMTSTLRPSSEDNTAHLQRLLSISESYTSQWMRRKV